jgi:hypothetical protein
VNVQPYGLDGHAARHPSTAGRPVRIEPVLVLRHRAATATRRLRRLRRRANVESRDSPRAPLRTTPTPSAASLRRPPPAAKRKRPRRRDRCAARGRVPRAAERAEQAHVGRPGRRTGTRHCPHRSKAAPCLRCPNSTVTLPPPRPVETRPSKPARPPKLKPPTLLSGSPRPIAGSPKSLPGPVLPAAPATQRNRPPTDFREQRDALTAQHGQAERRLAPAEAELVAAHHERKDCSRRRTAGRRLRAMYVPASSNCTKSSITRTAQTTQPPADDPPATGRSPASLVSSPPRSWCWGRSRKGWARSTSLHSVLHAGA